MAVLKTIAGELKRRNPQRNGAWGRLTMLASPDPPTETLPGIASTGRTVRMKVFISSLITGMDSLRDAAREAVLQLGHEPVMAEDFGARPHSPQVTCLSGVREAGLIILTHEEYREAKDRCPGACVRGARRHARRRPGSFRAGITGLGEPRLPKRISCASTSHGRARAGPLDSRRAPLPCPAPPGRPVRRGPRHAAAPRVARALGLRLSCCRSFMLARACSFQNSAF
jgi:Domain of unknown function (DUF4062)